MAELRIKKALWSGLWSGIGTGLKALEAALLPATAGRKVAEWYTKFTVKTKFDPKKEIEEYERVLNVIMDSIDESVKSPLLQAPLKAGVSLLGLAVALGEMGRMATEVPYLRPMRKAFRPEMLSAEQIIDAWRRGAIKEKERDEKLGELGIAVEDIQYLLTVTKFIPQVQDVIRFAVREVYTPKIVEDFKLSEGFEGVQREARPDLDRIGIDAPDLKKYWQAHWELPSVQQGFEMLQRGVITLADLKTLLRVQDIMPFWADKLTEISFLPFTRVDIRRMHKVGVLTDADLVRAYMDIGYTEDKAKQLAEFTIRINRDPESTEETFSDREAQKNRDLTRADILKLYKEGFVERAPVEQALQSLGYSFEETTFLVNREDLDGELERASRTLKNLRDGFLRGVYSREDVLGLMGQLSLPGKFTERTLFAWEAERAVKVEVPTKAELLKWYKRKLLTRAETEAELSRLGYPSKWVELYLKEIDKGGTPS